MANCEKRIVTNNENCIALNGTHFRITLMHDVAEFARIQLSSELLRIQLLAKVSAIGC